MGSAGAPPAATKVAASSSSTVSTSTSSSRLKRENCLRTKHDSAFSKWQILIGPLDWENYLQGSEGAERYRVQNLPTKSGPGVYEIGVAVLITRSGGGREVGKLEPDRIVVVYLGQAENVRSRLQKYGRGGSHLENKYSLIGVTSSQIVDNDDRGSGRHKYGGRGAATGLFMEVFSRGYPIVYRWAPLSSKSDAERTEAKLLGEFDYAWNKVSNGARRPNDVLHKIDKISSKTTGQIPRVIKWLQSLNEPKYGVPIKATKLADGKKLTSYDDSLEQQGHKEVTHVFKLSRWCRPRLIKSDKVGDSKEDRDLNYLSGLTSNDGSIICMSADHAEIQKRYAERKGSSANNTICSRSLSDSLNSPSTVVLGSDHGLQDFSYDYKEIISSNDKPRRSVGEDHFSPICGVILLDGSPCRVQPSPGRKRCQNHKGQRIHRLVPNKSITEEGYLHQLDWLSETEAVHKKSSNKETNLDETSEIHNLRSDQFSTSTRSPAYDDNNSAICGLVLGHGEYCMRQPAAGRKRCEEHKGMRVNGYMSKISSLNRFLRD